MRRIHPRVPPGRIANVFSEEEGVYVMEFNATYPLFGQGLGLGFGPLSIPRYEFVPVRFTNVAATLRDESRRSTLRMQWRVTTDTEGKLCLRAVWDARRHLRSMSDQA
jgi:hypothetical protein